MSLAKKKKKSLTKHKRNLDRIHRPPGIIHVYQNVHNPVKHKLFCFGTDNFNLLLTEMISLCIPSVFQAIFVHQCVLYMNKRYPHPTVRSSVPDIPILIPHLQQASSDFIEKSGALRIQEAVSLQLTHELHGAFLVDCVLSRTHKKPRIPEESPYYELVHRTHTSRQLCSDEYGDIFRTVIIVFPYTSVFWTSAAYVSDPTKLFSEVQSGIGTTITTSSLVPLPLSWLRLVYKTGEPAFGSFIKRINKVVWTINYDTSTECPKVPHSIQFHDGDTDTPLRPPDFFGTNIITNVPDRRLFYRAQFERSGSNRVRCRRYVPQALYQNLQDTTAYIHDPRSKERKLYAFQTTFLDANKRPTGQSNIVVSFLRSSDTLCNDLTQASNEVVSDKSLPTRGNACRNAGDHGQMSGFRVMFDRYKRTNKCISLSEDNRKLKSSVRSVCLGMAGLADKLYPGLCPLFKSLQKQSGITIPEELGGSSGFCSNIAISVDLENAAHVDVNDASVCLVAFAETTPHSTTDWYFVFPDVLLRVNGRSYNGLVVKLTHGVTILFDGRVVRHCTSRHKRFQNPDGTLDHTVGWFFGTSLCPVHESGPSLATTTP